MGFWSPAVDIFPVYGLDYDHDQDVVLDGVENPVPPLPHPIFARAWSFSHPGGRRPGPPAFLGLIASGEGGRADDPEIAPTIS